MKSYSLCLLMVLPLFALSACAAPESTTEEDENVNQGGSPISSTTSGSTGSTSSTTSSVISSCLFDSQCNDSNDCTNDKCVSGKCQNVAVTYPKVCSSGGLSGYCSARTCLTGCDGQPDGTQCWTSGMILGHCTAGMCGP